jgi:hypothetical protein
VGRGGGLYIAQIVLPVFAAATGGGEGGQYSSHIAPADSSYECLIATCPWFSSAAISFMDDTHWRWAKTLTKVIFYGINLLNRKLKKLERFFTDIGGDFLRNLHLHDGVVRDDQRKAAHHHSRIKNMYFFITKS